MPAKILHIEDAFIALQSGDEKGLTCYFNHFFSRLLYFSESITKSETASQDIVSDSFLKLWQSRKSLKQNSHVRHFLYQVVRNSSINYLREIKKDRQRENTLIQIMPVAEKHILEKLIEAETYHNFYAAFARLPKKCRIIFEMFYLEKRPVKEIARVLSISVNTVKSQKQRALQLLKEYSAEDNLLFLLVWLLLKWPWIDIVKKMPNTTINL